MPFFKRASKADDSLKKETILIAGIEIYAHYKSDRSNPFNSDSIKDGETLKLQYLHHGRETSAEASDKLAQNLLTRYYKASPSPTQSLVIITLDHRNHGKRTIDPQHNKNWDQGNETYAADILSHIFGGVVDIKSIDNFLPTRILGFSKYEKIIKLISGVSMGGHTTVRTVIRYPGLFDGAVTSIGCYDLTSLYLNTLGGFDKPDLYKVPYDDMKSEFKEISFPRALFDLVSKEDAEVAEKYDFKKLKTLSMFGDADPVVPSVHSESFLKKHGQKIKARQDFDPKAQFQAIKYKGKHEVTNEMIEDFASWLINF